MEQPQTIRELFHRYLENTLRSGELDILIRYFNTSRESELRALIGAALLDENAAGQPVPQEKLDELYAGIRERLHPAGRRIDAHKRIYWLRGAAAAALLALSVTGYLVLHRRPETNTITKNYRNDIAPGHNQATLTLANGQKIILTKGLNGKLATQGHTLIAVNAGQGIAYTPEQAAAEEPITYNTLTTKRGEASPYPLVLADGTKVWLNAASSITFPTAFNGKERSVTVTGEAYFEVVHNAARPFRVNVNGQVVEDLGTRFDINAYVDEPVILTALLEGKVKVTGSASSVMLTPGQQAITSGDQIKVTTVNAATAVAWKDGKFKFANEDIRSIMRKVARWYDVEVVYQGDMTGEDFTGGISRYDNVSKVLDQLETTRTIRFKVEGRRITVMR